MNLVELSSRIQPLDQHAMQEARARQAILTKPQGSLGRLEELSVQIAGITGQSIPILKGKEVVVMAGDHGVTCEGVSAYPQEVTPQMVANFLTGGAAINVLARHVGAKVLIVDMGVACDMPAHPDLLVRKVAYGTANIAAGPAMTRAQAEQALLAGARLAGEEIARGIDIFATGDMGIGNTTPSAAIAAAVTGHLPAELAGRGTGVDDAGWNRKVNAIERALAVNKVDPSDGIGLLAPLGGYEIGGLAGLILGAAANRRPVVVDGFISTAAALIASQIAPQVKAYLILAHTSQEKGHRLMMEWLGQAPLLDLRMRLGEGTGAVLAISLVEAACKILGEMATFASAGVSGKA